MKAFVLFALSPLLFAQTAVFPGAVATTQNLGVASNRTSTTLAASIGASDASFSVAAATGVATPTVLTIDDERIHVCSVSGNTFAVCSGGRAYDGSIAAAHTAPAKVAGNLVAAEWNQMVAEVIAAETRLLALGAGPFALASDLATANTAISNKADNAATTAALGTKALASDLATANTAITTNTAAIATKADATATTTALATKVGIAGDLGGTAAAPVVSKLRGTPLSGTAPTDGQVLTYSSASTAWLPVSIAQQMDTRPLHTAALKPPNDSAAIVAAGTTTTLANLTGAGTMEGVSFASIAGTSSSTLISPAVCSSEPSSEGGGVDSQFTLVVDGVAIMDHVPAGIFFNFYGYNSSATPTATRFYQINLRSVDHYNPHADFGASRKLMVHYNTSLTLAWTNTSPCGQLVFSGVDYRTGTPAPGLYNPRYNKIHATYVPFTSVAATTGTAFSPLPTVTPGSAGLLHSIDIFVLQFGNSSNPTWAEGHPVVTVDGTAGVTQKGTEDFFGSHFYWANGLRNGDFGQGFVGPGQAANTYYAGAYRYFVNQPCTFETSLAFGMENGHVNEGSNTSLLYSSLIIWYTVS